VLPGLYPVPCFTSVPRMAREEVAGPRGVERGATDVLGPIRFSALNNLFLPLLTSVTPSFSRRIRVPFSFSVRVRSRWWKGILPRSFGFVSSRFPPNFVQNSSPPPLSILFSCYIHAVSSRRCARSFLQQSQLCHVPCIPKARQEELLP